MSWSQLLAKVATAFTVTSLFFEFVDLVGPFPELDLNLKPAVRRGKGVGPQRVGVPPGSWFVPPGNNRSSGGGNEAAEAFGAEGRNGDLVSMQAVTRVNAKQASKRVVQEPTRLSLGEGRRRWTA